MLVVLLLQRLEAEGHAAGGGYRSTTDMEAIL